GPVTFDTTGSLFDTALDVYTGSAVNAVTEVASNNDISGSNKQSRVTFNAVQSTTYNIAIDGAGGAATGKYLLNWAQAAAGLNTFLLSASATPSPDLVAIGATPSGDGILNIPGNNGSAFFAAAAINIGAGAQITASIDDNGKGLALMATVCQSDPATAACVNP